MNNPEIPIPGPAPLPIPPPYVPPDDSKVRIAILLLKTVVDLLDDSTNPTVPYYMTTDKKTE
jgi:hypothetical protein